MAVQRRWDREERPVTRAEAPLGDLIRDLGQDGAELVRQEINLAKLEIKEALSRITSGAIGAALWGAYRARHLQAEGLSFAGTSS